MSEPPIFEDHFTGIVREISEHYGTPRHACLEPVAVENGHKVFAVWRIRGINYGLSVRDFTSHLEIRGWIHEGVVNSVVLKCGRIGPIRKYIRGVASLVELIPE